MKLPIQLRIKDTTSWVSLSANRSVFSYKPLWPVLQLQYATKGSNFPSLDSVKLVFFEHTAEEKRLSPDKDSPETWGQTSSTELYEFDGRDELIIFDEM